MAVDFHAKRDKVFARYPIFRSTFFERRMLFERRHARSNESIVRVPETAMGHASIAPRS